MAKNYMGEGLECQRKGVSCVPGQHTHVYSANLHNRSSIDLMTVPFVFTIVYLPPNTHPPLLTDLSLLPSAKTVNAVELG